MLRGLVAIMLWCAAVRPARADDGYLARLAAAVRARLDEAAAAHVVRLVPPVPVKVTWSPQRRGSIDVGAPVVAVAAADLDGDGKAELYLVTPREVIAVAITDPIRTLGRFPFGGEPAVPAPRDAVGAAVVEGGAVIAAVSAWAAELRIEWRQGKLTASSGPRSGPTSVTDFPVCGERWQLVPGRNYFHRAGSTVFGARCRGDLTDAGGAPLRVRGELATSGALEVAVDRCAAGGADCQRAGAYQVRGVGVAFEIADVDRDGTPELIASSAVAPGDADVVRVIPLGSPGNKPRFKKSFIGGVAGLAVADTDGDGVPEVLALVRLAGATRVDVWRLN
ncbi:MAG TPA: hypothetical protein VF469_23745 [Kofleriaceae bacterium]